MSKPNDPIVKLLISAYRRGKQILKEREQVRAQSSQAPKNTGENKST